MNDKIEYPKWLYHKSLPAAIVQNKDEHDALGEGWFEHPDEAKAKRPFDAKKS